MPKDIEILPPNKNGPPAPLESRPPAIPAVHVGHDSIDFFFNRRRWNKQARAVDALARLNQSEAACVNAQTAVVEADTKLRTALVAAAELPERLGHELQLRRGARAEELRALVHTYGMKEMQRERERLAYEAETNQARAALVDSEQALQAQRDFGYPGYELAWKRKAYETFGVDLTPGERRQIVGQYLKMPAGDTAPTGPANAGDIDDALYEARAELQASGLDTSRIDAIIGRRERR
jgi:hypothetical protein